MGNNEEKKEAGFFERLKRGLSKTRAGIVSGLESVFMGVSSIDEDFYEEIEEILLMGDLGMRTTEEVMETLREQVEREHLLHPADCKALLARILKEKLILPNDAYTYENCPSVIFVIGVNGVGKTTTVGKLAARYQKQGKRVLMAAADTFRAAAIDQLTEWSNRSNVPVIAQKEGADPAAVVFDAVEAAKARNTDLLLIDTAGRLHNRKNLMDELRKMDRIISEKMSNAHRENWLVLDATTGQNAVSQAKEFMGVSELTGIILTKMDGTAKGGIVFSICSELKVPVKFIGVGEQIDDLQKFDPEAFVDALFEQE